MPLVRIDLRRGKPQAYGNAICDGVYRALRATSNVPDEDRFMIVDILARPQSVLEHVSAAIANSPSPGFAPYGAQPPSPTRGEGKRTHGNG